MDKNVEIEAKAMLAKSDYEKLSATFSAYEKYEQTNFYIESDDKILCKNGLSLRIRKKKGQLEGTMKVRIEDGHEEYNFPLVETDIDEVLKQKDVQKIIIEKNIDPHSLKIVTSLTTNRIDIPYKGGLLSLDKNEYEGLIDYEIEFEYSNLQDANEILESLLKEYVIPFVPSPSSKSKRALDAHNKKPL